MVSVPASLSSSPPSTGGPVSSDRWSLMRKAGLFSSLLHVGGSEQSELHVFIGVRGLLLTSVDHQGRSQSPQRTAWFWRHLGRVVRRLSRPSVRRLWPACAGVGSDADNVLFSCQKLPERHHTWCCFVRGCHAYKEGPVAPWDSGGSENVKLMRWVLAVLLWSLGLPI